MSVVTAAADQSVCAPLPVLGRDVTVPLVTGGEVAYAALVALEQAEGPLVDRIRAGMDRAAESIDSGAAKSVLDRWVAASHA